VQLRRVLARKTRKMSDARNIRSRILHAVGG
jgi:hypothetical protein